MRQALALARRGQGRVEPNPMVGCVIANGSRVIGKGFHRRFGGPHAEVYALRSASGPVRGATVYVTLEPCGHFGKTPPCADALIQAGVGRVVAAMMDPGPHVRGRGFRKLRAAGIKVDVGLLQAEARDLNRPYLKLTKQGRPFVILKWAQTLDGRISTRQGMPPTISGPQAHRWVHRLRARVDAILVGVNTVLADDPQLIARGVRVRRIAARVVLDSKLRLPLESRLARTAKEVPTVVMTTETGLSMRRRHAEALQRASVEIVTCRARSGRVDLDDVLRQLGDRHMTNLMVEGGGEVLSEFLRRDLADEAYVFVSPRLLGEEGVRVTFSRPISDNVSISCRRMGPDSLYHVRFQ